jgi:hypothetical protein
LASFDYAPGYPESHRETVALSRLEAVGMDQFTGMKHVMKAYLAGVREAGTRAEDRWPIKTIEQEIDRFLRHLCIYQGRLAPGIWSEPDEEISHAVHEMTEDTIRAVCAARSGVGKRKVEPKPGARDLADIAARRQAVVTPILTARGWTVSEWAIQANVDFHTADNYLNGMTKKLHPSTRRDLAKALGLEPKALPL